MGIARSEVIVLVVLVVLRLPRVCKQPVGGLVWFPFNLCGLVTRLVQNLANDEFGDCEQCIRATSSVDWLTLAWPRVFECNPGSRLQSKQFAG